MRLNEEKILVGLMVIGILIIGNVLLIQIADSNINKFNNEILINQGKLNNILINSIGAENRQSQYNMYQLFKPNISFTKNELKLLNSSFVNTKWKESTIDLMEGKITPYEFFTINAELYGDEHTRLYLLYNTELGKIEEKLIKGTPWHIWKKRFVVSEVILIVLSLFGYYYLYKEIKNRIYYNKNKKI